MSIDLNIGPWTEWRRLYERDGILVIQTMQPNWVVKYAHSRTAITKEIEFLRDLDPPLRNRIELPSEPHRRFGENWYAMRRYTGSVCSCRGEVKGHWRKIAIGVLNFLEDLHRGYQRVHLDITLRNILYDRAAGCFVVSDYELIEPVSDRAAVVDDDDDHLWYYIGAGAELSAPIESWRMDLTMLGYALDELTRADASSFGALCQRRRREVIADMNDYDIIARRNQEMAGCHVGVRAYLDRVAALVDWRDTEPPPASIYNELRAIFSVTDDSD